MIKKTEKLFFLCILASSLVWVFFAILLVHNTFTIHQNYYRAADAHIYRHNFANAAENLRMGTDTLTEQVRLFAITCDIRYLLGYFREKYIDRHRERAIKTISETSVSPQFKQLIIDGVYASRELEYTEYRAMNLILEATSFDYSLLPRSVREQLASNPLSDNDHRLSTQEKIAIAQSILCDDKYHKMKRTIWNNVNFHMIKAEHEAKQQYQSLTNNILHQFHQQFIYIIVLAAILFGQLVYAIILNRLLSKNSKKLEEANTHLVHEAQLIAQESEMKRQQAKLEIELKNALKAEEARSLFFASVSHDIRTPLNSIIGFTDILRHGNEPASIQKEYLDNIAYSGEILMALINDVLDLAKLEAGMMQFYYDFHDFQELEHSLIKIFKLQTEEKDIRIVQKIEEMPMLFIDMHRVRQILYNLIGNALKFTSKGTITITASCHASGSDTKTLVFAVEDTGIGIAQEDLEKLAQPYVQIKTASTAKGTGLGLAICKMLLEKMNGTLEITSKVGRGSKFTVTLNNIRFQKHKSTAKETNSSSQFAAYLEGLSLLIVDDTPLNLKMLTIMCTKLGITQIHTAENGKKALDLLRSDAKPNIVMTDIQMPVMDGMELVAQIRKDANLAKLPVYAVTADVEMLKTYHQDGFTGLLIKPYDTAKLSEFFKDISQS